jgi:hypothetical protein
MKKTSIIAISLLSLTFGSLMAPAKAVECSTPTQKNCTVTVRDKSGIKIGTQEKGSNGTTTVRDKSGIKQGTITSQPGKPTCEILRDSRGIKVGTRGKC